MRHVLGFILSLMFSLGLAHEARAFGTGHSVGTQTSLGDCAVTLVLDSDMGRAWVNLQHTGSSSAGGRIFSNFNLLYWSNPITEEEIAACLGTDVGNVSNLQ